VSVPRGRRLRLLLAILVLGLPALGIAVLGRPIQVIELQKLLLDIVLHPMS
jgi:hypothetical protein